MDAELLITFGVGFTGVALLLGILASIAGSIPFHAFLYLMVWAPCLCFSQIALGGTIRPAMSTTIVLFGAWWAFLVGSIVPLVAGSVREAGKLRAVRKIRALAVLYL